MMLVSESVCAQCIRRVWIVEIGQMSLSMMVARERLSDPVSLSRFSRLAQYGRDHYPQLPLASNLNVHSMCFSVSSSPVLIVIEMFDQSPTARQGIFSSLIAHAKVHV